MKFFSSFRIFIEKIIIFEKDGKLDLKLNLNGNFPYHKDYYDEDGEMINKDQEKVGGMIAMHGQEMLMMWIGMNL